jgi:hypothetical protein
MGRVCGTHGKKRNTCRVLMGKHEGKGDSVDRGVHGRIILKLYRNSMGRCGVD